MRLNTLAEIASRRGYRQYLRELAWYRIGRALRIIGPDPRWVGRRATDVQRSPGGSQAKDLRRTEFSPSEQGSRDKLLCEILFERSPYEGFDPTPYPTDLQGWGGDDPVLTEAIHRMRPRKICEVGSWKGRSAVNMGRAVKALGMNTEIVCVDTWLGSPEHWKRDDSWYSSLRIENGMPTIYYTFLANVMQAGLTDVITPCPMTSENAAVVFAQQGFRFDIVYVDAAHEYAPAKRDFELYYDLLGDDGLLVGDDYMFWPEVTRAVDDFVAERKLRKIGMPGKVVIPKGSKFSHISF